MDGLNLCMMNPKTYTEEFCSGLTLKYFIFGLLPHVKYACITSPCWKAVGIVFARMFGIMKICSINFIDRKSVV